MVQELYSQYVHDTLLLVNPQDVNRIDYSLNSFDKNL